MKKFYAGTYSSPLSGLAHKFDRHDERSRIG